jgi:L-lactate dehydrogenase complex protein LldE
VSQSPRVGLFVTCLVDLFRPVVGFAAVKLLEDAGCTVAVPALQTCCGQPAYNGGDRSSAQAIARDVIDAFEDFDYVVAPSGSCAGMLRRHYPNLLADDPAYASRATAMAVRVYELTAFLADVRRIENTGAERAGRAVYHDSCSCLRDLGVHEQPRRLLRQVAGLDLAEAPESDVCCGFGGAFAIKYGEVSGEIVGKKCAALASTGAGMVLSADLGCLLNIAGCLRREGSAIEVRHVAEVLAGMTDVAAIAAGESANAAGESANAAGEPD